MVKLFTIRSFEELLSHEVFRPRPSELAHFKSLQSLKEAGKAELIEGQHEAAPKCTTSVRRMWTSAK